MVKKKSGRCLLVAICLILILIPMSVEATVYNDYKSRVNLLAKCVKSELDLGGGELVKGVTVTSSDQNEWNKISKALRKGLYGDQYDYRTPKSFNSKEKALGYIDTVVGKKYRYLELIDVALSYGPPYYGFAEATKLNKKTIDYYINNQSRMYQKLNSIYNKEIKPYKSKNVQTRLAIIITCVDNYLSYCYDKGVITNNLAYTINTKKGVCSDYAFMTDYFLRKMGFATRIVGTNQKFVIDDKDMGYHSINAVKVNGRWFYIDTTNMDNGNYAIYRYNSNTYFSSDIDYLAFPGWKIRCVY